MTLWHEHAAELARDDHAPARDLAAFIARVRHAWTDVRVDSVDVDGATQHAKTGETLTVTARVRLGDLTPEDVTAELIHGHTDSDGRLDRTRHVNELAPQAVSPDGLVTFVGSLRLTQTGSFGYTVRIVPRHAQLISPVELGLVALPG